MKQVDADIAVVGKGLIGSAAARHLSRNGQRVVLIGPDEPVDPAQHDGPFGSHYDAGRLAHRSARKVVWAQLAARSMAGYRALETASGVAFYEPRGTLTLEREDSSFAYTAHRDRISAELGFSYTVLPTPAEVQRAFPLLSCPPGYHGLLDPVPSGYINPRALLRAQLAVAEAQGVQIVREAVTALQPEEDMVRLTTASGRQLYAGTVILATGAHLHSYGLTPGLPPITVKSEVVTLAEVDEADLAAWQVMPTMLYDIEDDEISEIYLIPPVRYPDGRWYFKLGSNGVGDRFLSDHTAISDWMRSGDATAISAAQARAIRALFPAADFRSFRPARCMISRTAHGLPFIDRVAPRVIVAAGCNGSAAKSSDSLGELAACLADGRAWPAPFRREDFQVPAADQPTGT